MIKYIILSVLQFLVTERLGRERERYRATRKEKAQCVVGHRIESGDGESGSTE